MPSLPELLHQQAIRFPRRVAYRFRNAGRWGNVTWAAARACARACAASLIEAGVRPGDRVAIVAPNRIEWVLADLGILAAGAISVPIHAGLPPAAAARQLTDSGAVRAFAVSASAWEPVRAHLPANSQLRGVTFFEGDGPTRAPTPPPSVAAELDARAAALRPDDPAVLLYTSGTTGEPKGVVLTHGNLTNNAAALVAHLPLAPDATVLNWLPLSHAYARTSDLTQCLTAGAILALADSPETLRRDLREVRPQHVHGVPRFYEKMLADTAPARLRAAFGGRSVWLMSGGAPLSPSVARAYRDAGLTLLQGYGLTEAGPVVAADRPECIDSESVGHPLPSVGIRLADDGELWVSGPGISPGYWGGSTSVVDGWLPTGDLADLTSTGALRITGRKKDVIVLSTGRKVQPAGVESVLRADPLVDQVIVYGDSRPALAALVVPRWPEVVRVLGRDGLTAEDADVRTLFEARFASAQTDAASWERVRSVVVVDGPFRVEAGELTVSLKPRREVILGRYAVG